MKERRREIPRQRIESEFVCEIYIYIYIYIYK
jgi:hypothetical protein